MEKSRILRKVLQSALQGYHCRTWKKLSSDGPLCNMHDFCYILLYLTHASLFGSFISFMNSSILLFVPFLLSKDCLLLPLIFLSSSQHYQKPLEYIPGSMPLPRLDIVRRFKYPFQADGTGRFTSWGSAKGRAMQESLHSLSASHHWCNGTIVLKCIEPASGVIDQG